MTPTLQILNGDCREMLNQIPDASVQCCVTSPPYFGLRDYNAIGQIGKEKSPKQYVESLTEVFQGVKRVLRDDGTVWLNLGDSYASSWPCSRRNKVGNGSLENGKRVARPSRLNGGLKEKDLIGIPWMVAFALRADGWYLRSDIVWAKPNPMPESVTDRPTRSHEYIFLLSKSPRYYYDHEAIKDKPSPALIKQVEDGYNGKAIKDYLSSSVQDASATKSRIIDGYRKRIDKQRGHGRRHSGFNDKWDALTPAEQALLGSNKRDVWTVAPANYREAHFATFPPELIRPCVLAGSKPGDVVLDPFGGSGTTAAVAMQEGRNAILIELNPEYVPLIEQRISKVQPSILNL